MEFLRNSRQPYNLWLFFCFTYFCNNEMEIKIDKSWGKYVQYVHKVKQLLMSSLNFRHFLAHLKLLLFCFCLCLCYCYCFCFFVFVFCFVNTTRTATKLEMRFAQNLLGIYERRGKRQIKENEKHN